MLGLGPDDSQEDKELPSQPAPGTSVSPVSDGIPMGTSLSLGHQERYVPMARGHVHESTFGHASL